MTFLPASRARWIVSLAAMGALSGGATLASCSSDDANQTPPAPDAAAGDETTPPVDAGVDAPTSFCATENLPTVAWNAGPYGTHRGDIAGDFQLPLNDGTTWSFQASFTGCESYVVLPDQIPVSETDNTSVWASAADLAQLVKLSPRNVHYFFVSNRSQTAAAAASVSQMQARLDALFAKMSDADAAQWRAHLHLVSGNAQALGTWMSDALVGYFYTGFAIDRAQRIRGVGYLADVSRYDAALASAGKWPWTSNLAYAAYEGVYMNGQASQAAALASENATVIDLWKGETLAQFAEKDVMLPDAAKMAGFDTMEVEITQRCPDPTKNEFAMNCGAWDYIASLSVEKPDPDAGAPDAGDGGDAGPGMVNVEIGRFITSYHRETHWVEDITPMLVHVKDGGMQRFKWDFAPPWNTQPTATSLSIRLSNKKKGYAPAQATFLYAGGAFDSKYDNNRNPISVMIPSNAKHVELWSIITGHGQDMTTSCSEFCNHQHQFTVGGSKHLLEFPMAGNDDGCIATVATGTTPNQGGTWWLGRGGWCPGGAVTPWVVDVTKDVTPGQTTTIDYQGMYANATPPDGSGNIDMISYLAVYE